jgi:CheY-like chemotaxis protein
MAAVPGKRLVHEYQDLMRHRIMDILLVSTPYDTFILEEVGELQERMLGEFRNLDLHYAPALTGVSSGEDALRLARGRASVNLIITTPHLADMDAIELARRARSLGIEAPVVLLAWDTRELSAFRARLDTSALARVFLWQGDARILVAIVKSVEDQLNAPHDTASVGVQVILLVEDNVRYYSSFLPVIYTELLHHSQRVISEGLNLSQKILRMRARPKILLCTTWEEAEAAFTRYAGEVLGIISDVEFPRAGNRYPSAGADLAREVRAAWPDVPIVLHSSRPENESLAASVGAKFLLKGSPLLLQQLREVMLADFGFGDFVFRSPQGAELDRAGDLRALEQKLGSVPESSLVYHAQRNHFSRWLKARTEFALAHELRPRRLSDYESPERLRASLIGAIARYRREQSRTLVTDFDSASFDLSSDFYRMGGGSLGGKARGLAFVRRLLAEQGLRDRFAGVEDSVPVSAVLGTDVFDRFLDENDLRHFAIECEDDDLIRRRFQAARFPQPAERDVAAFLRQACFPLAVRSSSLLEDSQRQPFTGVYDTLMIANDSWSHGERLHAALSAIKGVYASTFGSHAKAYLRATSYRLGRRRWP